MRLPLPKTASSTRNAESESGLWLIGGQIALMYVLVVGYGSLDDGLKGLLIKPTMNLLATLAMVTTVIVMSPRGRVLRLTFPIGVVLYITWWLSSYLWTAFPPGYSATVMPEFATLFGLIVLGGILPRDVVMRTCVNAYYAIVVLILIATVVQPGKSLNSLSVEGKVAVRGWHGAFLHKNIMTPALLFGTVLILVVEHRRWVKTTAIIVTLALTTLGNSGTGLAAFAVVMTMYWWLDRFLNKNKRMGVAFVFMSVLITAVGAWATASVVPAILDLYGKDLSFSGRTKIWNGVLDAIAQRPWHGWGAGGVWVDATQNPTLSINKPLGFFVLHSHNGFLEVILRYGFVGLLFWLIMFCSTLVASWRVLRIDPQVGKAGVLVCVLIVVFAVSEISVFGIWIGNMAILRVMAVRAYAPHSRRADPSDLLRRTAPQTGSVYTTPVRR